MVKQFLPIVSTGHGACPSYSCQAGRVGTGEWEREMEEDSIKGASAAESTARHLKDLIREGFSQPGRSSTARA